MNHPLWLSDLLELAELLLRLGERDDVKEVLDRIEAEALTVGEAVAELRKLH